MVIQMVLELFTKSGAPLSGYLQFFCLVNLKKATNIDKTQKYNVCIRKNKLRDTNKRAPWLSSVLTREDSFEFKYSAPLFSFKANQTTKYTF